MLDKQPFIDKVQAETGQTVLGNAEARLKLDPEPLKLSFDATVLWRNRTVEVN